MNHYTLQMRATMSIYALLFTIVTFWLIYNSAFTNASVITLCNQPMLAHDPIITLEPDEPVVGSKYVISTAFTMIGLEHDITDGTEDLKVSLSGYPIVNQKLALCENVPCPIGNGFHNFSWDGDVPSGVHGDIDINEDWKMTNGSSILCFTVVYQL